MYIAYPSGSVITGGNDGIGGVQASYGRRSPDLENEDNTAWFIGFNGSVKCTFDYGYTSYGFL